MSFGHSKSILIPHLVLFLFLSHFLYILMLLQCSWKFSQYCRSPLKSVCSAGALKLSEAQSAYVFMAFTYFWNILTNIFPKVESLNEVVYIRPNMLKTVKTVLQNFQAEEIRFGASLSHSCES